MAFDPKDKTAWRDFAHTTGVFLSSALAEFEARQKAAPPIRVFDFELLAAASEDAFHFLDGKLQAREGGMQASIEDSGGKLHLKLN